MTPSATYQALLIVQALHLLHHRLAKRHISFAEGISGAVLCVPPTLALGVPPLVFMITHGVLIGVQIVGSLWIRRLSPAWRSRPMPAADPRRS